jgi:hypothetical protein
MNLAQLVSSHGYNFSTPGVVMGSAPSVKLSKNLLGKKVLIGLGDLPWRAPKIGPFDFWVTANNIFPIPWNKNHARIIKQIGIPTLISCVSQTELNFVKASIEEKDISVQNLASLSNVIPYDSVHLNPFLPTSENGQICYFGDKLKVGPSMQELVFNLKNENKMTYSSGHTVAIHGFALAVLLKLNPIYLCGIEIPITMNNYKYINNLKRLNYSNESLDEYLKRMAKNYFDGIGKKFKTDFSDQTYNKIINDFSIVASIARELGINVINLSPKSSLSYVEGITTIEKI